MTTTQFMTHTPLPKAALPKSTRLTTTWSHAYTPRIVWRNHAHATWAIHDVISATFG